MLLVENRQRRGIQHPISNGTELGMCEPARGMQPLFTSPVSDALETSALVRIRPHRPRLHPAISPAVRYQCQICVALQRQPNGIKAMGYVERGNISNVYVPSRSGRSAYGYDTPLESLLIQEIRRRLARREEFSFVYNLSNAVDGRHPWNTGIRNDHRIRPMADQSGLPCSSES